MVVISVLSRQLWWCYLFLDDCYGGVISSKATDMMVLSVLRRQLSVDICFSSTVMLV